MIEAGREPALRVAVAGVRMGEWHARAVAEHPYAELRAVCDTNLERAEMVAATYEARSTYTDFTSMLDSEELDGVSIATPNALHAPMIRAALARGLHVMCDKPLTLDTDDARQLLASARDARRVHGINFSNRPNPAVHFVKEHIDRGSLGRIYEVHLTYLQDWLSDRDAPYTWRNSKAASGSGALGDIASHMLDLGRLFVGEVQSVSAHLGTVVPERIGPDGESRIVDVDDLAYVQLQFEAGAHGLLRVSRVARGRCDIRRVEIFGEQASLVLEIDQGISRVLRADEATAWKGDGFREVFAHDSRIWTWGGNIKKWIDCARRGEEVSPNFEDGLRCQEILDSAIRSADERRWIDVDRRN
jgi:predicted dehydrogenase